VDTSAHLRRSSLVAAAPRRLLCTHPPHPHPVATRRVTGRPEACTRSRQAGTVPWRCPIRACRGSGTAQPLRPSLARGGVDPRYHGLDGTLRMGRRREVEGMNLVCVADQRLCLGVHQPGARCPAHRIRRSVGGPTESRGRAHPPAAGWVRGHLGGAVPPGGRRHAAHSVACYGWILMRRRLHALVPHPVQSWLTAAMCGKDVPTLQAGLTTSTPPQSRRGLTIQARPQAPPRSPCHGAGRAAPHRGGRSRQHHALRDWHGVGRRSGPRCCRFPPSHSRA